MVGWTTWKASDRPLTCRLFQSPAGFPRRTPANIAGQLRVDRTQCPTRGNLYTIFVAPETLQENLSGALVFRSAYIGVSTDAKLGLLAYTFTDHKIFAGPVGSTNANLFPALAVDDLGFLYAVWSDNTNIFLSSSSDTGNTWTPPVQVNQGSTVGKSNVFPWVDADANGHVVVAWFGADRAGNSNDPSIHAPCPSGSTTCMTGWTNWNVYVAETTIGHDPVPFFTQTTATDHVNHRGTISTGGLTGSANRNMGDFFKVALDPQHRANIAFGDDHVVHPLCNTTFPTGPGNGHCGPDDPRTLRKIRAYFTRQQQTTPGIVTTGSCAVSPPETGNKITGGGRLGPPINFGFVAKQSPLNGALSYHDDNAGLDVHSSNGIDSLSFSGNCGTFTGNAKVNKQEGYRFTVTACDNADPGANQDTFSIQVTGPSFSYNRGGTITDGNIQFHKQ